MGTLIEWEDGKVTVTPDRWDTTREYEVDRDIDEGKVNVGNSMYWPDGSKFTWFDPDVDDEAKDLQVQLGCLFNATVCWNDTGDRDEVIMATYETEGTIEDDMVCFSFGGESYGYEDLVLELKTMNDDFYVVDCDLFSHE